MGTGVPPTGCAKHGEVRSRHAPIVADDAPARAIMCAFSLRADTPRTTGRRRGPLAQHPRRRPAGSAHIGGPHARPSSPDRGRSRRRNTPGPGHAVVLPRIPTSFVRRYRTQGPRAPASIPSACPPTATRRTFSAGSTSARSRPPRRPQDAHRRGDGRPHRRGERPDSRGVAAKRFKGSETVKTQRRSILLKLGARNMAQAVGMTHRDPRPPAPCPTAFHARRSGTDGREPREPLVASSAYR